MAEVEPSVIGIMGDRRSVPEPGHLAADMIAHINDNYGFVQADSVTDPFEGDTAYDALAYTRLEPTSLERAHEYAEHHGLPLYILSTKFDVELPDPEASYRLLAPNISTDVLRFMDDVGRLAAVFSDWELVITEHHQEHKADISGTALKIREMIGQPDARIESVRDWSRTQAEYDLPDEARGGYAIHEVEFLHPDGKEGVKTGIVIVGRDTYGKGLVEVHAEFMHPTPAFEAGLRGAEIHIVDFYRDVILNRAFDS